MGALPFLPGLLSGAPLLHNSKRSLIVIWMDGGMSHIDTFDGKPEAPTNIRGDLVSLESSLEGVFLSEHLPLLKERMNKLIVQGDEVLQMLKEAPSPTLQVGGGVGGGVIVQMIRLRGLEENDLGNIEFEKVGLETKVMAVEDGLEMEINASKANKKTINLEAGALQNGAFRIQEDAVVWEGQD